MNFDFDNSRVYANFAWMSAAIYHFIVFALAGFGAVRGFHRGFTRQIPSALGLAFGVVGARLLGPDAGAWLGEVFASASHSPSSHFAFGLLGATAVFIPLYLVFAIFTRVLRAAMSVFDVGIVDALAGSAFGMLEYVFFVSLAFNLILAVYPGGKLLQYALADDGNVVECVTLVAPAFLGCDDCLDLAHTLQLHEAKKISNISAPEYVLKYGPQCPEFQEPVT